MPVAYHNGRFEARDEVGISILDRGFLWGATVTDRARTIGGIPFRLDDHLHRFQGSARAARVPIRETIEQLLEISTRLIATNLDRGDLAVIWVATPGVQTDHGSSPTCLAYTQPVPDFPAVSPEQRTLRLQTVMAAPLLEPTIKHRNRLGWWIAAEDLREKGDPAEPLFVDPSSHGLLETPTSNIILVEGDRLVAPLAGTVLEGVSMRTVLDLAAPLGLSVERRPIQLSELNRFSEALACNTTSCIRSIVRIDGQAFPDSGPVFQALCDAWLRSVNVSQSLPRGLST